VGEGAVLRDVLSGHVVRSEGGRVTVAALFALLPAAVLVVEG